MQRAGVTTVSLLLYTLFVIGGTCLCLALLALAGHFVVWHGLDFPIDVGLALRLMGLAGIAFVVGALLYGVARRLR